MPIALFGLWHRRMNALNYGKIDHCLRVQQGAFARAALAVKKVFAVAEPLQLRRLGLFLVSTSHVARANAVRESE